jgi:hypothetical protein
MLYSIPAEIHPKVQKKIISSLSIPVPLCLYSRQPQHRRNSQQDADVFILGNHTNTDADENSQKVE